MGERFSRIFTLPGNLHSEGVPVTISAGALLKDNQTGKVLAQLKFLNINEKKLTALKVKIRAFDVTGAELAGVDAFSYLDVSAEPGAEFGQKTPIYLPDKATRSYTVTILSAVFADGEVRNATSVHDATAAKQDVLDKVAHIRAEKAEAILIEKVEKKKSIAIACIPLGLTLLAIVMTFLSQKVDLETYLRVWGRILLTASLVPVLCIVSVVCKNRSKAWLLVTGIAALVCIGIQIACSAYLTVCFYPQLRDWETYWFITRNIGGSDVIYYVLNTFYGAPILYRIEELLFITKNAASAIIAFSILKKLKGATK